MGDRIDDARRIVAAGLVAGDLSPASIARFAGVHIAEAVDAVEACREAGIVDDDGGIAPEHAARLLADLPVGRVAEIHALAARHWMTQGPEHLVTAVEHAKAAGTLVPLDELIDMADRGGRLCLSLHDYESAAIMLGLAVELDVAGDPGVLAQRFYDLALACNGLGQVVPARAHLARAASLAERVGDAHLLAAAAVAYAQPVDWYAGDTRAAALLARAESLDLDEPDAVKVLAARALVEIRIPVAEYGGQQVAWVTRASVAHRLADEAVERSVGLDSDVRSLAVLAWRTTHRSPAVLDRRREMSAEALDLAQVQRRPSQQMDAAVWLAVDALESADRGLYDEAISVARWVAERDGNPRLVWRAHTLAAGAAHLDGDIEEAERRRKLAREVGESVGLSSWLGAELCLIGQRVISLDDLAGIAEHLQGEDSPLVVNPIGRALNAYGHALLGDHDQARRMVRSALRQLDPEASYLLLATRCVAVTEILGDVALAEELVTVLEPWREHVAVDSNAWWCDGPVHLWLAVLHDMLGDHDRAADEIVAARVVAESMHDVRSLRRAAALGAGRRTRPVRAGDESAGDSGEGNGTERASAEGALTEREVRILALMAVGSTNREIAHDLRYSVSTIRADTISIYRKLGAKGRAEAVARALATGLIPGA
jgi:DNA-binding CsgD family transcriptional regulator/tetratricopeptide (TPR) repeat protein